MINIRTLEIKMKQAAEKLMNLSVYGITSINLSDGGFILTRNDCSSMSDLEKKFVYDEQYFYQTNQKSEFMKEMNNLAINFVKFRELKQKVFSNWNVIMKSKNLSENMKKTSIESSLSLKSVLQRLRAYNLKDLKKRNKKYIDIVKKYKLVNSSQKRIITNKISSLGSFMSNPAEDCSQIKNLNKNRKTGFYWIKPRCSKTAIKVFCDFSIQKGGVSIYIYNNNQRPNTILENDIIQSYRDIRYICAKKGLYPIEIKNKDYVSRIFDLLKYIGWDLSLPYVIPLGYDYECENGNCANQYTSLNIKESENILSYLTDKDQEILNTLEQKDTLGFGYSDELKPYFFDINEANYTAIICSTNEYGEVQIDNSMIKLSCNDNLINRNLDSEIGKTIKVKCPKNCHLDKSKLYGHNRYSKNSSICKAGIHSGVVDALFGGVFEIKISPAHFF